MSLQMLFLEHKHVYCLSIVCFFCLPSVQCPQCLPSVGATQRWNGVTEVFFCLFVFYVSLGFCVETFLGKEV